MGIEGRTWSITHHALDRFVERFAPDSDDDEASRRMLALLEDAVEIGRRDTGTPEERGFVYGSPLLPAAAFLCRPDAPGQWVCVTTLDSRAHQRTFRGAKGGVPRRPGGRGGRMFRR